MLFPRVFYLGNFENYSKVADAVCEIVSDFHDKYEIVYLCVCVCVVYLYICIYVYLLDSNETQSI